MLKHTEVFSRCFGDGDYPALMQIESLCSKDLDAANAEYSAADDAYKKAKAEYDADKNTINLSKKNWAEVEKLRAQIAYSEKVAVYYDFMNN